MGQTLTEKLTATTEGMRLYQQERAILEVTELLCRLMDEQRITRSQLAKRLGISKGYVTQLLDGRSNMTLRTVSDVFFSLGRAVHFQDGVLAAETPPLCFSDEWHWPAQPKAWPGKVSMECPPLAGSLRIAG